MPGRGLKLPQMPPCYRQMNPGALLTSATITSHIPTAQGALCEHPENTAGVQAKELGAWG